MKGLFSCICDENLITLFSDNTNASIIRQEALKQAERERRMKYKKQDDEREVIRSSIRDKVSFIILRYCNIIYISVPT